MNIHFNTKEYPLIKSLNFGNMESDITVNTMYYMKDGKPKAYVAGEFHFERYSREFWEEEILKMKAGGIDVISAYIIWLFHEPKKGEFNFSGDFDDSEFLALCKKHNMGVIMRIGPYVHGELRHGGLPDFIFNSPYNRSNNPKYLSLVERYWTKLYENTKEYYDGKTVIGIQLENEYVKGFDHLLTLRNLAEKVGFKTPIFTVTGWGFTFDNSDLQGTYGGYPARPWAQHKKQMPVQGNFTIRGAYHDYGIGDDTIKYTDTERPQRIVDQPNFTCECGCGNQVTEHRREIISTKDAYGVPFTTVANGCNWLGYYMYHGSNNPRGGLYQESRITLSPNNCPVIDYDFQAPLGRFGYPKESYKKLKSLNYFLQYFGDMLAPMWKYYDPKFEITEDTDVTTPRICVRADEKGSGFLFASTYEREAKMPALTNVDITVDTNCGQLTLPQLNIDTDEFVMYPFNIKLGNVKFDYITASPVAHITKDKITTYFFKVTGGLTPEACVNGKISDLLISEKYNLNYNKIDDNTRIAILSEKLSDDFYIINNKVIFSNAVIYGDKELNIEYKSGDYCVIDDEIITLEQPKSPAGVRLKKQASFHAKYSRYLFSPGKRGYYKLSAENLVYDNKIIDYIIDFKFSGAALQMYSNGKLVSDFYNIDGSHEMSLKYFKNELCNGNEIDVVTAPFSKLHKIYTEKDFEFNNPDLTAVKLTAIYKKTITL